ncbi:dihydrodipicolinate synthase family protein [Sulfobacillus harzensis]|uniref:Dihydrodipicolinate synthase family protein n=1 Tax=Sulfobacillus harzensis TaxID=2729629 RepID=A0A7Y0L2X7_9FIRM|nr:dihydrodipicolinate synthase family protein [Sulfobacillus harzensis]NMP21420.1 dihydrodipicolinate synthase family protein [Sulfobacillus harzensis]
MATFNGVYVAVVTPFNADSSVDLPRFREHLSWLIESGVDGIVPTGSCGEYASLDDGERASVIETVAEVTRGKVPFVVGVAAPTTAKVVHWTTLAKSLGAQGVMALPPVNYRPTWEETRAYYQAIDAVGLPVIIYNNPHDTAVDMPPARLRELQALPNIVAVKEFSGDVRRITEIQEVTQLEVLAGADDLLVESVLAGAKGWIAGMANIVPEACVRLYRLATTGKTDEAWALYRKLLPLLRYDSTPRLVQVIKYGMECVGQSVGMTRAPRLGLTEEEKRVVSEVLAGL